jgi:predicted site-specific integrase-resolvase
VTDIQVTAAEAASMLGVARATIDTWVHRGHLTAIEGTKRPKRFWLSAVYAAETARRVHPTRRMTA